MEPRPALGLYRVWFYPYAGATEQGSGPWKGSFMLQAPPRVGSELHVAVDYAPHGPKHQDVDETCTAASSLTSSGSYHEVNTLCDIYNAMHQFVGKVIDHKRLHEEDYNLSLETEGCTL